MNLQIDDAIRALLIRALTELEPDHQTEVALKWELLEHLKNSK